MHLVIPDDIRAEVIYNYLGNIKKTISFIGNHKRNVYEDISSISQEDDTIKIELSKQGLYDILPEALFHPIDRFDNLPSNEYKERIAEEVEQQRIEETNARTFFSLYDQFIFELSSKVSELKQVEYNDSRILSNIICDSLPSEYLSNRFITRTIEFTPLCKSIRGNSTKITLMLRKIMAEEGLKLTQRITSQSYTDTNPKYVCHINKGEEADTEVYLGNTYEEDVLSYNVHYWNDKDCNESFLRFVEEIKEFENFLNDYFMGIGTSVHFDISAHTLPVRLSDEMSYNFLDYNTNI